jgi:hypothetical protein
MPDPLAIIARHAWPEADLSPEASLAAIMHPFAIYCLCVDLEAATGRYPTDAEVQGWQTVGDVLAWATPAMAGRAR